MCETCTMRWAHLYDTRRDRILIKVTFQITDRERKALGTAMESKEPATLRDIEEYIRTIVKDNFAAVVAEHAPKPLTIKRKKG